MYYDNNKARVRVDQGQVIDWNATHDELSASSHSNSEFE